MTLELHFTWENSNVLHCFKRDKAFKWRSFFKLTKKVDCKGWILWVDGKSGVVYFNQRLGVVYAIEIYISWVNVQLIFCQCYVVFKKNYEPTLFKVFNPYTLLWDHLPGQVTFTGHRCRSTGKLSVTLLSSENKMLPLQKY